MAIEIIQLMFAINNLIAFISVLCDLLFSLFPDLLIPSNYWLAVGETTGCSKLSRKHYI